MGIIKMNDSENTTFKISNNEKSPDSFYGEEVLANRLEKVNQKITLFSILIPAILGIILLVGYLDLRYRITGLQASKESDVETLTEDLQSRLESIKKEYIELESTLDSKISYIDKNTYQLKQNLAKSENTLKNLKSSMVDKKEQEALISRIDKKIVPVQKGITDLSAKMETLEASVNTRLEQLSKSMEQTRTELAEVASKKIDKDALDIELLKEKKYYQQQLSNISKELNSKISSLQSEINVLEREIEAQPGAAAPAPGNISEKNLNEEP